MERGVPGGHGHRRAYILDLFLSHCQYIFDHFKIFSGFEDFSVLERYFLTMQDQFQQFAEDMSKSYIHHLGTIQIIVELHLMSKTPQFLTSANEQFLGKLIIFMEFFD